MDTCQHEGCNCQVQTGQSFCADYCAQHGSHGGEGHACECGHPNCAGA